MIETSVRTKKCQLRILDPTGDTKQCWDPARPEEVAAMKKTFDDLTKKGYRAFKVQKESGARGEAMETFDPNAAMVILVPALAGG